MNYDFLSELDGYDVVDLNEALDTVYTQKGIMGTVVNGLSAAMKNPLIYIPALALAFNAYDKYRTNQRYVTKLFGRTNDEKRFYDKMVKDLIGTKKWRLITTKYENGGKLWVMKRINESKFEDQLDELKKNRSPLSPSERKIFLESECVGSDGNIGIWRSIYNGKTVYVSNSENVYRVSEDIDSAIKNFNFIWEDKTI